MRAAGRWSPNSWPYSKQRGSGNSPPGSVSLTSQRDWGNFPSTGGVFCSPTVGLCPHSCGNGVHSGVVLRAAGEVGGFHLWRLLTEGSPLTLPHDYPEVFPLYTGQKRGPGNVMTPSSAWQWTAEQIPKPLSTATSSKINCTWHHSLSPVGNNPKASGGPAFLDEPVSHQEPKDTNPLNFSSTTSREHAAVLCPGEPQLRTTLQPLHGTRKEGGVLLTCPALESW